MPRWTADAHTKLVAELRTGANAALDAAAYGRQAAAKATEPTIRARDLATAVALKQQAADMTADADVISGGTDPAEIGYVR